ncbi:MAG: 50S ribosomal protein L29 [Clostridia bacterium]|nr:50S ribosomal protein L29 [Clostridia bacterium]
MKPEEIRELSNEELERKVEDLKEELFNLRFQMATGQLDNPLRIREVRRDIARVKTILRERELKEERAQMGDPARRAAQGS